MAKSGLSVLPSKPSPRTIPKASLNSPELYKLKDRFPIQIDLEANDIKEICYSRLLGKSPSGEDRIRWSLFDKHGQALRHNTKLVDARAYGADFDKQTFINLYPFLPAHFDILLHLLGALAKSTGGIGLRSAIKVIQDVLVEGADHSTPIANQPVGWLATTVTLFDALKKDIEKGYLSLYQSVGKVKIRFPDSKLHQDIAKTVCVLQILGNLPISIQNVTSLMHGGIADPSAADQVKKAVEELISDAIVPLGEQDGNLCFHSEKLNDIEQERGTIPLRADGAAPNSKRELWLRGLFATAVNPLEWHLIGTDRTQSTNRGRGTRLPFPVSAIPYKPW